MVLVKIHTSNVGQSGILNSQVPIDFAKIYGLYWVVLTLQASKARERIFEGKSSAENKLIHPTFMS